MSIIASDKKCENTWRIELIFSFENIKLMAVYGMYYGIGMKCRHEQSGETRFNKYPRISP
jgi:hypothetical protein